MGTDIYMQIEVRIDGKWEWLQSFFPYYINKDLTIVPDDRNYILFAILANVTNGYNFNGFLPEKLYNPIDKPRGIPEDISEDLKDAIENEEILGEHSFSHLNGKELREYDWEQITKLRGLVTMNEYKKFQETGDPKAWVGRVNEKTTKIISNKKMDDLIKNQENHYENVIYLTQIELEKPYKEIVGGYSYWSYSQIYDNLIGDKYHNKIKPEDIRIVFGFDS